MRSGLVVSGSAHGLMIIMTITHGLFLLSEPSNLPSKSMDIYIVSEAEFDAESSSPPVINVDHEANEQKTAETSSLDSVEISSDNTMSKIKQHEFVQILESVVVESKPSSTVDIPTTFAREKKTESEVAAVIFDSEIAKLEEEKLPSLRNVGNEIRSVDKPSLEKPIARSEDRIDKIASNNKDTESISDIDVLPLTESTDESKNKKEDPKPAGENKAATTEITPDGTKDAPIVVSGALENAVIPPSREINQVDETKKLDKKTNEQLLINNLVASLNEDQVGDKSSASMAISTMEKIKLRKNINQLIGRYWNKGILIGGSDFENYLIQVEILLDSKGNIIGDVRAVKPSIPTGRYAIAFREASNAIKAAGRIPIPSEKYKNGVRIKLTFDPASGIGFE